MFEIDALCAYRTAYKNPMRMSSCPLLFDEACHFPVELENCAFWAIKAFNFNMKQAGVGFN